MTHEGVFLIVTLSVFIISGLIWVITKYLAKIGIVLIPILCGIGAMAMLPEKSKMAEIIMIAVIPAFVSLGVVGSLSCYLHATLFDLESGMNKVRKNVEDQNTTEDEVTSLLDIKKSKE